MIIENVFCKFFIKHKLWALISAIHMSAKTKNMYFLIIPKANDDDDVYDVY